MNQAEEVLAGGLAHPGKVVRVGQTVRRPRNPFAAATTALLEHIHSTGLLEVPRPLGVDERKREIFSFIPGDVPLPPYPLWALADEALISIARLLRRLHEAVASFDAPADARWSGELADPRGGPAVCHNDVCLENVIFRDGQAVGLIDFDFAAPGRTVFDVVRTLRLAGSLGDPQTFHAHIEETDQVRRIALFCDAYELAPAARSQLLEAFIDASESAATFIRNRAAAGHPSFLAQVKEKSPEDRLEANKHWVERNRSAVHNALTRLH